MRKFVIFAINLLLLVVTPAFIAQLLGRYESISSLQSSEAQISVAPSTQSVANSGTYSTRYSNTATQKLGILRFSEEKLLLKVLDVTMKASLTSVKTSPFSSESLQTKMLAKPKEHWCMQQHLDFVQSYSS